MMQTTQTFPILLRFLKPSFWIPFENIPNEISPNGTLCHKLENNGKMY